MRISWALWLACEICCGLLSASDFYVATTGTASGDGSQAKPWDIKTAFAQPASVNPGDVLNLHGGRYYIGALNSSLSGAAGIEIIVRSVPGEWAVLDTLVAANSPDVGQLNIYGGYTVYRDFEVTCTSSRSRVSTIAGSFPWDQGPGGNVFRGGVSVFGTAIHCVNLVLHDLTNGIFSGHTAVGGSIYGCVGYNIGWKGPDRGHGHLTYMQGNGTAPKYVENCVALNCYDDSLNFYGSDASFMKDLHAINNTGFGSGNRNLAFTGECVIGKAEIRGNVLATAGKEDTLAINSPAPYGKIGTDIVVDGNYIVGAIRAPQAFTLATVSNNTLIGGRDGRFIDWVGAYTNTGNVTLPLTPVPPDHVIVRPNKWQPGRVHVTVVNWSRATTAKVTTGLPSGGAYEVRSVYDPTGAVVAKGTVSDPITIPLGTVQAAVPISATAVVNPADIRFQAFVITSTPGVVTPPPVDPPPTPVVDYKPILLGPQGRLYVREADGSYREVKLQ